MKTIRFLLYIFIGTCLLQACAEEDFTTFGGEVSGIYIQRDATTSYDANGNRIVVGYCDSVNYSFASAGDVTEVTQYLTVKIMGNVADYDRPFTLKVDEERSSAIRGVHFDFEENDCVILANTARTSVPVTLFRHADLTTGYFRAEFYLESNEYFTTELEQYKSMASWSATGDTLCGTRYTIRFSEILTRPTLMWMTQAEDLFGEWSPNKETLINQLLGYTHTDWTRGNVSYGELMFAVKQLRRQLQEAADAGNPVLDEDGSYMQFVPPYEIDYSAYN